MNCEPDSKTLTSDSRLPVGLGDSIQKNTGPGVEPPVGGMRGEASHETGAKPEAHAENFLRVTKYEYKLIHIHII